MKTFFWGFFSTPWKRLFRTISIIVILSFSYFLSKSVTDRDYIICLSVLFSIPLLSYLIEPFVIDKYNKEFKIKNIGNIPKNEILKIEIENKIEKKIIEINTVNDDNSKFSKYFKFNNEYLNGISYFNRMLVSVFTSIIFGLGLILMVTTIYKRSKSLGFDKSLSILNCIIIPIFFVLNLVISNIIDLEYSDDNILVLSILPLILGIPHLILLFKNGTRKKMGKFQIRE